MTPPDTREQARAWCEHWFQFGGTGLRAMPDALAALLDARDAAHAGEVERLQALLDDGDAALALRFEAAWDAGHGAACADAAFLAASLERETQLRADLSRVEALRQHDIEAWQKEAIETTRLRAEVATLTGERDEARGLLEDCLGHVDVHSLRWLRKARAYLSRSPVEGGRE